MFNAAVREKFKKLRKLESQAYHFFENKQYRESIAAFFGIIALNEELQYAPKVSIPNINEVIANAYFMIGQNYYQLNEISIAVDYYQKALLLDETRLDACQVLTIGWIILYRHTIAVNKLIELKAQTTSEQLRSKICSLIVSMVSVENIDFDIETLKEYAEIAAKVEPVSYLNLGNYLLHRGRIDEAISAFYKAARRGLPEAFINLGNVYFNDQYGRRNMQLAIGVFEKASEAGLYAATYNLAVLYDEGIEIPRDLAKAKVLYQKAIEQGSGLAAKNLAVICRDGEEGNVDFVASFNLFKRARDLLTKNSESTPLTWVSGDAAIVEKEALFQLHFELGQCYEFGLGVEKVDLDAAQRCYEAAISGNNIMAKYALGRIHFTRGDFVAAKIAWQEGAALGDACAKFSLASMLEKELDSEKNTKEVEKLYLEAAAAGIPDAQVSLIRLYIRNFLQQIKPNSGIPLPPQLRETINIYASDLDDDVTTAVAALDRENDPSEALKPLATAERAICIRDNKSITQIYKDEKLSPQKRIRAIIKFANKEGSDRVNLSTAIHRIGNLYKQVLATGKTQTAVSVLLPEVVALLHRVLRKLDQLSHWSLCNVIEGVAHLHEFPGQNVFAEAVSLLHQEVMRRAEQLDNKQRVTAIYHTASNFGLSHPDICQSLNLLIKAALKRINVIDLSDGIRLLYAIVILDHHKKCVIQNNYHIVVEDALPLLHLITDLLSQDKIIELEKKHTCYLILQYFLKNYPNLAQFDVMLLEKLESDLKPWFMAQKQNAKITELQKTVTKKIMKYFPDISIEHPINGLPVDIYLTLEKTIVQVNGPLHYMHQQIDAKNIYFQTAKDCFHDAILKFNTDKLISINFDEVEQLDTEEKWYEFLKKKFVSVGVKIPKFEEQWSLVGNKLSFMPPPPLVSSATSQTATAAAAPMLK